MDKFLRTYMLFILLILTASSLCFASIAGSTATPVPDYYISGTAQDIAFLIWNNSTDAEWLDEIIITFPVGWVINSITHYDGPNNSGSHLWLMEGEGTNVARWYNTEGYGVQYSQSDHYYAVNITVPPTATGLQTVSVDIYGDVWGDPPHEVFLDITLYELVDSIYLIPYESYGSVCAGDSFGKTISVWNNTGYELDVDLSYIASAGYTVLFVPNPVNVGPGEEAEFLAVVTTPETAGDGYTEDIEIHAINQINGVTETYTSTAYIYATTYTDYCVTLVASLNDERLDAGVVAYANKLYAFGGYHDPEGDVITVEIYDPLTDTWTYGTPMPAPYLQYPASAANVGDQVLIQNGEDSAWKIYNITSDSWTSVNTPFNVSFGGQLASYGDKIYLTGGASAISPNVNVTSRFYEYDIASDTWTQLPDMPDGAWWHTTFAANGKIYVMGGFHGTGSTYNISTVCWAYDLANGTWDAVASMPAGRWGSAGAYNGEDFILAGGNDGSTARDDIYSYDPEYDVWTTLPAVLPEATFRFDAAALSDGSVYTVGGFSRTQSFYGYDFVQKIKNCSFQDGPDAAIFSYNITFDPPHGLPGDLVEITAVIMNLGNLTVDSGNANIFYYLIPDEMTQIGGTIPFGPIPPGGTESVVVYWDTTGLEETVYTIAVFLEDILPFDINLANNQAIRDYELPVELSYFTAFGYSNKAYIRWQTLSEVDNFGWNLYRLNIAKINDYISYIPVLLTEEPIPGQGTSHTPHNYIYIDNVKHKGKYFYILEAISTYGVTQQWQTKLLWKFNEFFQPAKPETMTLEEIATSNPNHKR